MQKNVVGRLKNLENEMKNVLSICDIQKNEQDTNKQVQKREKLPIRSSSSNMGFAKHCSFRKDEEQASCQTEKPIERPQPKNTKMAGSVRKKSIIGKPSSAPPAGPSTINEEESHLKRKRSVQGPAKKEGIAPEDSLEWFDCSPQTFEAPEQKLRPVEEILINTSHYGNDYYPKQSANWCGTCRRRIYDCVCRDHWESQWENIEQSEVNKSSFIHLVKPDLKENSVINELARKIEQKEMEVKSIMREDHRKPIKCRHRTQGNEIKNPLEESKELVEYHKSEVFDAGREQNEKPNVRPMTAPAKIRSSNRYGMVRRRTYDEGEDEGKSLLENNSNEWKPTERDRYRDNENIRTVEDIIEDPNYVKWIEDVIIEQQESASDAESSAKLSEDLKNLRQKKNLSDGTTRKIAEIIERNHQKIEEMRRSRFLALSTVKSMKEKYDALAEMKNNMEEKLDILIEKNEKLIRELQEADETKQKMFEEWEKYKEMNPSRDIKNRLQYLNEENMKYKEKIQYLEQQLQEKMLWEDKNTILTENASEVSQMNQDRCHEYHLLFRRQEAAYRQLVQGIAVLEKVIRNNKEKEKRLSDIKAEVKRRAAKTQSYLEKVTSEKIELFQVVNELRAYVDENQSRIDQLEDELRRKDEEIENQKKILEEKSETLEDTNRELESIRKNSTDLEDQLKTLRKSIESFDQMHQNVLKERHGFEELVQRMKQENVELQKQISNEKDAILIKNKIIEDQQETIRQLREKSEEMKVMVQKIQSLERVIDVERDEKLELQETVERLRWKKEELKKKVKSLEADLLLAPQEVVRDLQKTQNVLHELENQVQMKQKEWEVLLQSLAREKEQACSVAAFATKQLIQTTNDYQKQSDAHKKLYKILTENLIEKKKHLQDESEKAKQIAKFSEDLHQEPIEGFDVQALRNTERLRCQAKQIGILRKSKEWFDVSQEEFNGCRGKSACRTEADLE